MSSDKLIRAGDTRGGEILDIILRDEIGHVRIGNLRYAHLCKERGLNPLITFAELARRCEAPRPRGPFNIDARRAAGFSEQELAELTGVAQQGLASKWSSDFCFLPGVDAERNCALAQGGQGQQAFPFMS